MNQAEKELLKMFGPEGNVEDYWLGNPPSTNAFMGDDQRGWTSSHDVVREMRTREINEEDRLAARERHEGVSYLNLMSPQETIGGGLYGVHGDYWHVLSGVIRSGKRARELGRA